jgi:hypothetical protein
MSHKKKCVINNLCRKRYGSAREEVMCRMAACTSSQNNILLSKSYYLGLVSPFFISILMMYGIVFETYSGAVHLMLGVEDEHDVESASETRMRTVVGVVETVQHVSLVKSNKDRNT